MKSAVVSFRFSSSIALFTLIFGCNTPTDVVNTQNAPIVVDSPADLAPSRAVCDPFQNNSGHQGSGLRNGIVAKLSYLPQSSQADYYKSLPYYEANGTQVDATLFLSELNVPTRSFDLGFYNQEGQLLLNEKGNKLYEYFSLKMESRIQLSPSEAEGAYQFALLSDDGAILTSKADGSTFQTLVDNDGTHPSKLVVAKTPVSLSKSSSLPIQVHYYQGPRYHISLMVLYRPWPAAGPADALDGKSGNSLFFDYTKVPSKPQKAYNDLLARGWKPVPLTNYLLPQAVLDNPCAGLATLPPATVNPAVLPAEGAATFTLTAQKAYQPAPNWGDQSLALPQPAKVVIPSELLVSSGNAGNGWATLTLDNQVTCAYRGGADIASPLNPPDAIQIQKGKKFTFAWCANAIGDPAQILAQGVPPNALAVGSGYVAHTSVKLRVDQGDPAQLTIAGVTLAAAVDSVPPQLSVASNLQALTRDPLFTLNYSTVDSSTTHVEVLRNQAVVFASNDPFATVVLTLAEGLNLFEVRAVDEFGNGITPVTLSPSILDTVVPSFDELGPADGFETSETIVLVDGRSNEPLGRVTVNGIEAAIGADGRTFSHSLQLFGPGLHSFDVVIFDLAGNSTTVHRSVSLVSPHTPVTILASLPSSLLLTSPGLAFPVTILSSLPTTTRVYRNNVEVLTSSDMSFLATLSLSEGVNVIRIESANSAGASAVPLTFAGITLDSTPPQLATLSPRPFTIVATPTATVSGRLTEPVQYLAILGAGDPTFNQDRTEFSVELDASQYSGETALFIEFLDQANNYGSFTLPLFFRDPADQTPADLAITLATYSGSELLVKAISSKTLASGSLTVSHPEIPTFVIDQFTLGSDPHEIQIAGVLPELYQGRTDFQVFLQVYDANDVPSETEVPVQFQSQNNLTLSVPLTLPHYSSTGILDLPVKIQGSKPGMRADLSVRNQASQTTFTLLNTPADGATRTIHVDLIPGQQNLLQLTATPVGVLGTSTSITVSGIYFGPILTFSSPVGGVLGASFVLSGYSSEPLVSLTLDGQNLALVDGTTFSTIVPVTQPELRSFSFLGTTADGRTTSAVKQVTVSPSLLNRNLVSIEAAPDGTHVYIIGSVGAAAPASKVSARAGFFGTNSDVVHADGQGRFVLTLNPFAEGVLEVTSSILGSVTESMPLQTRTTPRLVGSVMDAQTPSLPLPGVVVTILGTGATATSAADGSFVFENAPVGTQTLSADGRSIPETAVGPDRKYHRHFLRVKVGLAQETVLRSPIYLAPLILSESTVVTQGQENSVSGAVPRTSVHIPASVQMSFPDGASSGRIGVSKILEVNGELPATVPVPSFLKPKVAYAFEPSGVTFSERVDIQIPNDNELVPGTEVFLVALNTNAAGWEVGAIGVVDASGQTISSKPGQGLQHFSAVFPVPAGFRVTPIDNKATPGADLTSGALATTVDLPAFGSLGRSVTPKLVYKSNWAKPTALITNSFAFDPVIVNFDVRQDFFGGWVTSKGSTTTLPDFVDATFKVADLDHKTARFRNVPSSSTISYKMDLETLPSAQYGYQAHYDVHFKAITVGTSEFFLDPVLMAFLDPWRLIFSGNRVETRSLDETSSLRQIVPTDLRGPVVVQNQAESEIGRGWRLMGTPKIMNTTSNRLLLEEGDGSPSLYSINNVISTLVTGSQVSGNFKYAVNFDHWPLVYFTQNDQRAITSVRLDAGTLEVRPEALLPTFAPSYHLSGCTVVSFPNGPCIVDPNYYNPHILVRPNGLVRLPSGRFAVADQNGQVIQVDSQLHEHTVVYAGTYSTSVPIPIGPNDTALNNRSCQDRWGVDCPPEPGPNTFPYSDLSYPQYWSDYPEMLPGRVIGTHRVPRAGVAATSVILGTGTSLIVTDPELRSLREIRLDSNESPLPLPEELRTGNSTRPMPPGNYNYVVEYTPTFTPLYLASDNVADMYTDEPRATVLDSFGNLYVATEHYIFRVNPDRSYVHYAGQRFDAGGVISDEATPKERIALNKPKALALDEVRGLLYIADTDAHRVLRLDMLTGLVTSVAGTGTCSPLGGDIGDGGAALNASLCEPTQLGVDPDGNLLVVDSGHQRIRRVTFSAASNGTLAFVSAKQDHSKLRRNADGSWIRTNRDLSNVTFNTDGRAMREVDAAGRVSQFQHNSQGLLTEVLMPTGQRIQYVYSGGKLRTVIDPAGRVTTFEHQGADLTRVTYPDGTSRDFAYSEAGLLTSETDVLGRKREYIFNNLDRIETVKNPDGTSSTVNDAGSVTAANNFSAANPGVPKSADDHSVVSTFADPDGRTSTAEFAADGLLSRMVIDGNGVTLKYNTNAQLEEMTTATNTIGYSYNGLGDSTLMSERRQGGTLVSTTREIDPLGRKIRETVSAIYSDPASGEERRPTSTVESTFVGNTPLPLVQTNSTRSTAFIYNAFGLPSKMTTVSGSESTITELTYDSIAGNPETKRLLRNGIPIVYESYLSDLAGNITTVRTHDPATGGVLKTATRIYDLRNNHLRSVTTPSGETTVYQYFPSGQLKTVCFPPATLGSVENDSSDSCARKVSYHYDTLGRLDSKTNPLGQTITLQYVGISDSLESVWKPDGRSIAFIYDSKKRLVEKILRSSAGVEEDHFYFEYGHRERMTLARNKYSTYRMTFNSVHPDQDLLESIDMSLGDGAQSIHEILSYRYDPFKNRVGTQTSKGSFNRISDSSDSSLAEIQNPFGERFLFAYDGGVLTQIERHPASGTSPLVTHFSRSDPRGLVSAIVHVLPNGESIDASYGYNNLGELTTRGGALDGSAAYTYDLSGQLTSESSTSGGSVSFSYDERFNRKSATRLGVEETYAYDSTRSLLEQDGRYRYAYDLNGNLKTRTEMLTGHVTVFDHDVENRLVGVRQLNSLTDTESELEIVYGYDALGNRIFKKVSSQKHPDDAARKSSRFYVMDGQDVLFEYGSSGAQPEMGHLVTYTHSGLAPDDILSANVTAHGAAVGLASSSGTYYFLKDRAGSIIEIASSDGSRLQKYSYSIFGEVLGVLSPAGDSLPNPPVKLGYLFAGRALDGETGLYFNRARYFDPGIGRFIETDPESGVPTNPITVVNSYVYGMNSPTMFSDPSGRIAFGFGVAMLVVAPLISAAISLIQAGVQTAMHGGDFWEHFGWNFLTNYLWTFAGLAFLEVSALMEAGTPLTFHLGWGGIYTNSASSLKNISRLRGFSLGQFQFLGAEPFLGSTYWHEVGHAINFAIFNTFTGGTPVGAIGSTGFYFFHAMASQNGRGAINPFTPFTEGYADLWSSPKFKFIELDKYFQKMFNYGAWSTP